MLFSFLKKRKKKSQRWSDETCDDPLMSKNITDRKGDVQELYDKGQGQETDFSTCLDQVAQYRNLQNV